MLGEGGLLLWYVLVLLSLAFISIDIRKAPTDPVLKWAFVILGLFTGPFAAFFYVLGCREPLKDTHEVYVAVRWRQVLGSTMHCAAGDGIGIIAGAAIVSYWAPPSWVDLPLEYLLGFGFGWAFFQAFAMRGMAGGSYILSLKLTFLPEMLSMNMLMAGMFPVMHLLHPYVVGGADPLTGGFWFVMSVALIVGFVLAYPVNWWLVARGLKHGMITKPRPVSRPGGGQEESREHMAHTGEEAQKMKPSSAAKAGMTVLTFLILAVSVVMTELL